MVKMLVGGFKHGFSFPFHIWDVILPIDELHNFSRWAHCTTNQCKFRFIRFTLSREFLFCLRHPIFCERLSNSFCRRHVLVRRLLEMHLRLRPRILGSFPHALQYNVGNPMPISAITNLGMVGIPWNTHKHADLGDGWNGIGFTTSLV